MSLEILGLFGRQPPFGLYLRQGIFIVAAHKGHKQSAMAAKSYIEISRPFIS